MAAQLEIENCFGVPNSKAAIDRATQQWAQLRKMIEVKKWSGVRLAQHTRAFIETHKPNWRSDAPPWVVADFFGVISNMKLIPLTVTTPMPNGAESYMIGGKEFWRMKDGYELPFEKVAKKVLCSITKNNVQTFWHFLETEIPKGWTRCETILEHAVTDEPISAKTQALLDQFKAPAPEPEEKRGIRTLLDVEQDNEEPEVANVLSRTESQRHMEETKNLLREMGVKI